MSISIENLHFFSAFWLIFSRFLAVVFQLPHFDKTAIPVQVKILFSLILSVAFYPTVSSFVLADLKSVGADNFWMLAAFYITTGLAMGYFIRSIMFTFQAAGALITQQIGFAMVTYFDPSSSQQVGPFEKLIRWTVLLMIITTPALTPMLKGLLSSFNFLSLNSFLAGSLNYELFFIFFKDLILSALVLASPLIFTNVLISSLLGVIARVVPQMNIIMVSFIINIGLGLIVFLIISGEFFETAFNMYVQKLGLWFRMIRI